MIVKEFWYSMRVAVVVCVVGCFALVDYNIEVEGFAALARGLECGAVPQLSTLKLRGMGFWCLCIGWASGV